VEEPRRLTVYLLRVARSALVDELRAQRAVKRGGGQVESREALAEAGRLPERRDPAASPEEELIAAQEKARLSHRVAALLGGAHGDRNARLVTRWAIDGWTGVELAAAETGLSASSIHSVLWRARQGAGRPPRRDGRRRPRARRRLRRALPCGGSAGRRAPRLCRQPPGRFDLGCRDGGRRGDPAAADRAAAGCAAFAAVRPPGHHAERHVAMGFCYFNNVAVAAEHLLAAHGLARVAILDFDVHHGNGTQHLFEERGDVFYASAHQYPFYPGTGAAAERGRGAGAGATLNVPLPAGCGDAEYEVAFAERCCRRSSFAPEALLLSAGFDAWQADPLGGMRVTRGRLRATGGSGWARWRDVAVTAA
jgi:DNA-directed RNA polymerase specialized sigma24 family protein